MISVGSYPATSLKEARERRDTARKQIEAGLNPSSIRTDARERRNVTFEAIATEWLARQTFTEKTRAKAVAVRMFLAQRGMKKGDLAKFIEEAVRWRVLAQTVAQTKARNANVPVADIEAAINEALHAVRAERFAAER